VKQHILKKCEQFDESRAEIYTVEVV